MWGLPRIVTIYRKCIFFTPGSGEKHMDRRARKAHTLLVAGCVCAMTSTAAATPGGLLPTFGSGDGVLRAGQALDAVGAPVSQPGGNLLVMAGRDARGAIGAVRFDTSLPGAASAFGT